MSKNKIIALVGMPGSGKGTCADYLAEKLGYPTVHFGNMLYEEIQRRGLDNSKDENFVREDMRKVEGKAVFAKHAARKAQQYFKDGQHVVVFDGLYSWSEYRFLDTEFGDELTVIAVAAPKHIRRERVLNRADSHRKYTLESLTTREIAEIEDIEKGGPIAYADYTIVNDGAPEELLKKLDDVLAAVVA